MACVIIQVNYSLPHCKENNKRWLKMDRFIKIKQDWENQKLSDGEAVDEVLKVLKTAQPTLEKLIIETDGDELTDREALELVWQYYHLDAYIKIQEGK